MPLSRRTLVLLVLPPVAFALSATLVTADRPHSTAASLSAQNGPVEAYELAVRHAPIARPAPRQAARSRALIPVHKAPVRKPAVHKAAVHKAAVHRAAVHKALAPVRHPIVASRRPAAHQAPVRHPVRTARPAHAPAPAPRPAPPAPRPAPPAPPAPVGRNDYPYRTASGAASDPWGFTERQCVSFVAWRLAQAGRPLNNARQGWGSALTWDDTARRLGRAVTTRPSYGTVAQWNAGESSPYYAPGSSRANGSFAAGGLGHVAWVLAVYGDGSALVEQYNGMGNRSYSTMRVKAPRYLHLR